MGYEIETEIRQCDEDDQSLRPVFCTTALSTEDIKTLIKETHVDVDSWRPTFLFLDTLNSTPEALQAVKHATRHPSPPLSSPFSESWTPLDFYNFFKLHIRHDPNADAKEPEKFANFTFMILSAETMSSPDHIVTVCTDAPDYFEPDGEVFLKTKKMAWKELVQSIDCFELCITCLSEAGHPLVMNQQPPAMLTDIEYSKGSMTGKLANAARMRENRIGAVRQWEAVMERDGKTEELREMAEACRYKEDI